MYPENNHTKEKKAKEQQTFEHFSDNEFFEAMEDLENLKDGNLSDDEHKKNEYIRKTRENLAGGDP